MAKRQRAKLNRTDAVACFTEFGTYERHFNDVQGRYRALASTWLLGGIAAIGFILTNELHLSVDRSLLIAALAIAAAIGITLLWHLDLVVYHGLLHAAFTAGLLLEEEHPAIPPMHQLMRVNTKVDAAERVVYFYLVCTAAALLTACVAIAVPVFGDLPLGWALALVAVTVGIAGLWLLGMTLYTKNASTFPNPVTEGKRTTRTLVNERLKEYRATASTSARS